MDSIKYDVVIPLAKKDVKFVHWVIEYMRINFDDAQNIYILTNKALFPLLKSCVENYSCILIDENAMLQGLSFKTVRDACIKNNQRSGITGHYFQQFLKMGFALTDYCKDYYLTWDSDTIPLSHIEFFKDGKPQFCVKKEHRDRYFEVLEELLGINKQIEGSFIAEHMMFSKTIMRALIDGIKKVSGDRTWFERMIDCTDENKVDENIISEFEIYGNYCMVNYPNMYSFHKLCMLRKAGIFNGRRINRRILRALAFDLDTASFEEYDSPYSFLHYKFYFKRAFAIFSKTKITDWPSIINKRIKGESLSNI